MQIRVRTFKILIFVVMMCCLTGFSQPVSAVSTYDDYYHSTSTLKVQGGGCEKDITNTWMNHLGSYTNSFKNAVANNGVWGVSQLPKYSLAPNGEVDTQAVIVFWSTLSPTINWESWGYVGASSMTTAILKISACSPTVTIIADNYGTAYLSSDDGHVKNFFYNGPVNYPLGYDGESVVGSVSVPDEDGDNLDAVHELTQGTLDTNKDTDGDGINDYVESQWYPGRNSIFCGVSECAYPDPVKKDIYVEIDWMNDGTTSFKPTATQVGLVSDAFAAKDIHFHADTGQYGGGSLLSPYTAPLTMVKDPLVTDFFDFKDASFSADRKGIWRYMISGKNYARYPTSSGASFAGSDNIFVSNGLIRANQASFGYTDLDTAIAGTMLHEIGHSLCLSADVRYSYQDSACVFGGVDSGDSTTNSYPLYASSMNYYHQMGMVDYSTKPNLIGDHDDWSAVKTYMGDFTSWDYDTEISSGAGMLPSVARSKLSVAITTETAKELRKKGLLKPGKATWRHLQVKNEK